MEHLDIPEDWVMSSNWIGSCPVLYALPLLANFVVIDLIGHKNDASEFMMDQELASEGSTMQHEYD